MTDGMTVGKLIELLEDWPMDTPVRLGFQRSWPQEFVIGDPVLVEHADGATVYLADSMYIGVMSDEVAEALGWS